MQPNSSLSKVSLNVLRCCLNEIEVFKFRLVKRNNFVCRITHFEFNNEEERFRKSTLRLILADSTTTLGKSSFVALM